MQIKTLEKRTNGRYMANLNREWGEEEKIVFLKYIKENFKSKYSEEEAKDVFELYRSIEMGDEENAIDKLPPADTNNLYSFVLKNRLSPYLCLPPLHFAADKGLYKVVGKLIEDGANVDLKDENGYKPVYLAVQKNHPEVVELLVSKSKKSVNDNMPYSKVEGNLYEGDKLLSYAVKYGYDQVMIKLINGGANLTDLNSKTKIPSSVLKESLDNCMQWEECNVKKKDERKLIFNYENILHQNNRDLKVKYNVINSSTEITEMRNTEMIHVDAETPNETLLSHEIQNCNETELIENILSSSSCPSELLTHPTIKAFLFLKWKNIEMLFVIWILLKFAFFLFLLIMCIHLQFNTNTTPYQTITTTPKMTIATDTTTTTTSTATNIKTTTINSMATVDHLSMTSTMSDGNRSVICDHIESKNRIFEKYDSNWIFVCIFFIIFFISELTQIVIAISQRKNISYFSDFKNIIQWAIITSLLILLFPTACGTISHRHTLGIMLPMACYELLHEIGYLPGCAHIIEIFKIVSGTFLTYLSFYSLMIISFSASFFIILPKATQDYPSSFGPLFVKYIVMFTGEQEFLNIPFSNLNRDWEMAFYVIFLLLVSVVLMNVLNALAVRDLHEMMNEAEVPMLNQLFKTILQYDSLPSLPAIFSVNRNILNKGKLEFTPFKEETKSIYLHLKTWPIVKKMKKLFFYTSEVVDDECIHGHHGAVQILSKMEETKRIKKDKEMLRLEETRRDVKHGIEKTIRDNQIDEMLKLLTKIEKDETQKKKEEQDKERFRNSKMNQIWSTLAKLETSGRSASHHLIEPQPTPDIDNDLLIPKKILDERLSLLIQKTTGELLKTNPDLLHHVMENSETVSVEFEQIFLCTLRNFRKSDNKKGDFERQHSRVPAIIN